MIKYLSVVGLAIYTQTSFSACSQNNSNLRIAFDIGSGKLKMQAAYVDPKNNTITRRILSAKTPIPIHSSVQNDPNKCIPDSVYEELKYSMNQFTRSIKDQYTQEKIEAVATATEGFRRATNGLEILRKLENETGIRCEFLSQDKEALQGHFTLQAEGFLEGIPQDKYFVFENGNGSSQISIKDRNGFLHSCHHRVGKIFAKEVLASIHPDSSTPLTEKELQHVLDSIKLHLVHTEDSYFTTQMRASNIQIFCIGAMFSSVKKALKKDNISKEELKQYLNCFVKKKKTSASLSDLLFCYAMMDFFCMESLHIPSLKGKGSTSGLLIDSAKWVN